MGVNKLRSFLVKGCNELSVGLTIQWQINQSEMKFSSSISIKFKTPKHKMSWLLYETLGCMWILKNLDYDIKNIKESSKAVRNGIILWIILFGTFI